MSAKGCKHAGAVESAWQPDATAHCKSGERHGAGVEARPPAGVKRARSGMTLVEMMVVVGVIGVLLTMVSLAAMKMIERSRISQAEQDLARISCAIGQLMWDTGDMPSVPYTSYAHTRRNVKMESNPIEVSDLSTPNAGLLSTDGRFKGWKGPYLERMPKDPWGRNYFFDPDYYYRSPAGVVTAIVPAVCSYGPNQSGSYDADNIVLQIPRR